MKNYHLTLENVETLEDIQYNLNRRDKHEQRCPACLQKLKTLTNYVGGGSHYWHLQCPKCEEEYDYDTYRFKLEYYKNMY